MDKVRADLKEPKPDLTVHKNIDTFVRRKKTTTTNNTNSTKSLTLLQLQNLKKSVSVHVSFVSFPDMFIELRLIWNHQKPPVTPVNSFMLEKERMNIL